jgi:glycosyltransferase involved in cell wall biosynthesis
MKIAAVSTTQVPSTAANSMQVMKACQGLAQCGHDVTLLIPGAFDKHAELESFYGLHTTFPVHGIKTFSRRLFTFEAVRYASRLRADLLYTWVLQSATFAPIFGLPVVLEMHDMPSGRFGPRWYHIFLKMPGRKRQVCVTHALDQLLAVEYGNALRDDQKMIGPNGVDLERFDDLPAPERARQQLNFPHAPTILCAGHLYAGRGVDLFLDLAKINPSLSFIWVGGKDDAVSAYRSKSADLNNVIFTGFVPNQKLPLYQAAADVLLMPYGKEIGISGAMGRSAEVSSPMKMFEYLATGRAILSSDHPVFKEVLNDRNAVFAETDNLEAWNANLRALIANLHKRESLAAQARKDAERYTWKERARRAVGQIANLPRATK